MLCFRCRCFLLGRDGHGTIENDAQRIHGTRAEKKLHSSLSWMVSTVRRTSLASAGWLTLTLFLRRHLSRFVVYTAASAFLARKILQYAAIFSLQYKRMRCSCIMQFPQSCTYSTPLRPSYYVPFSLCDC